MMRAPTVDSKGLLAAAISGHAAVLASLTAELSSEVGVTPAIYDRLQGHAALISLIGLLSDQITDACGMGRHRAPGRVADAG
jgi:hypothetical protein